MPLKELDAIPELRDNPSLKDFNDLPTFAKSYLDTKAFVGSSIRPPGPDASPEARAEFVEKLKKHVPEVVVLKPGDEVAEKMVWEKLGRPAKREEYNIQLPEGVAIDLEGLRTYAEVAGLTKAQFEKLATKNIQEYKLNAEQAAKDRDGLKTEWGAAYEEKLKSAASVAQKLGQPESVVGAIMAGKLPAVALKTWASIAAAVGTEGRGMAGQRGSQGAEILTPAEAEARFAEIQAHPAYFDKKHPEHDIYVRKGFAVMSQLHPE